MVEREIVHSLVEVAREREQDPASARIVRFPDGRLRLKDPPAAADRHGRRAVAAAGRALLTRAHCEAAERRVRRPARCAQRLGGRVAHALVVAPKRAVRHSLGSGRRERKRARERAHVEALQTSSTWRRAHRSEIVQ